MVGEEEKLRQLGLKKLLCNIDLVAYGEKLGVIFDLCSVEEKELIIKAELDFIDKVAPLISRVATRNGA